MVAITCANTSNPTTSAVLKVALLARPKSLPVSLSTTSNGILNFSAFIRIDNIEKTPNLLAIKLGVSLAKITLLPTLVTKKVSNWGITLLSVPECGINSTSGI